MKTKVERLSPEVRARTIVAGCHQVDLTLIGDLPDDVASGGHLGILLDRTGIAYLVIAPDGRAPRGRLRVTCRARVRGLGVLRLEGVCGEPIRLAEHPGIGHLLALHRSGWDSGERLECGHVDVEALTVVPLCLDAVKVLLPATSTERASSVAVDPDDYLSASPEAWALEHGPTMSRLDSECHDELLSLASSQVDGEAGFVAVSVAAIDPHYLELACLSLDGVTTLRLPYGRRIEHPNFVRQWVSHAARHVA